MEVNFKYPIEYVKKKNKVLDSLREDLELLKTHDSKEKPIYEILLNPKTELGKNGMDKFTKYYTTDIPFLKDTQKINKKIKDIDFDQALLTKIFTSWNNIKNDNNFVDKYQYIGWDRFKWLNYSVLFLHILSIYNLFSPVFNLMSPLFLFIVPFVILKGLKVKITWKLYKSILMTQIKSHALGQLFTSFHKVKMSQKMYILFCSGMYIYNIYQNIISCYHFYKNAHFIVENLDTLKKYLLYTTEKMKQYEKMTGDYDSYKDFNKDLKTNRAELETFYEQLKTIPNDCKNVKNLFQLGKIMKYFYSIYDNHNLNSIIQYSFDFNGYIDLMKGINASQKKNKMNDTIFTNKKTTIKFKNVYHPSIENPIKNTIDFSKNKIITGPNAAGKTTILKSTIINTLFSQQFGIGYFDEAKLSPFDNFHCYINIPDTSGRDSLFQAEARRCKKILDNIYENPKQRHFCVFDELYSGTNPYEAISSAYGYIKYITKNKKVKFLLTTHFIRLCKILDKDKDIENCSMKTIIKNDVPTYYYKIENGISKVKGGITVLKEIHYPDAIIEDSRKILETLN